MEPASRPLSGFFVYVALAYAFTWSFWIPAVLIGQDVMSFPVIVLHTLGGFGPSVAGIFMLYRTQGARSRRDFWQRAVDFRRLGLGRTIAILLVFPLASLAGILVTRLLGGGSPEFPALRAIAAQPLTLALVLLMGFITGPIPEELGWRGFALPILQDRWGALRASLLLALAWWAWHLPLFFIVGTAQYAMGVGTLSFWLFLANILPVTLLITWFYNRSGGSILSAILLHYGFNVSANLLFPLPPLGYPIHSLILLLTAVALWVRPSTGGTLQVSAGDSRIGR